MDIGSGEQYRKEKFIVENKESLSPIQRITVTEKYRPYYEKKAKEKISKAGQSYSPKEGLQNSAKVTQKIDTRNEMSKLAGVSHDTYDKGHKILGSDNEEVKQKVLSGDLSIDEGGVTKITTCLKFQGALNFVPPYIFNIECLKGGLNLNLLYI